MRFIKIIFIWTISLLIPICTLGQTASDSIAEILESDQLNDRQYIENAILLTHKTKEEGKEYYLSIFLPDAIAKAISTSDTLSALNLLNDLATHKWQNGEFAQASDYFNEMRLLGNVERYAEFNLKALNGLGNVNYLLTNYNQALDYYQQGLTKAGIDSLMLVKFIHNIANVYMVLGQRDSVLYYYQISVDFHLRHDNFKDLSTSYGNIALVYAQQNDRINTAKYIEESLHAAYNSGDKYQISWVLMTKGYILSEIHPELSIKAYNEALKISGAAENHPMTVKILNALSYQYKISGDLNRSLDYLNQAFDLQDSILTMQNQKFVQNSEDNFRRVVLDREISEKNQKAEVERLRKFNRQRLLVMLLVVVLLASLIIFFIVFRNYRMRIRFNKSRERLFTVIAHDLRNPLNGVVGLSEILLESGEASSDKKFSERIYALHQSAIKIKELTDNLLDWSYTESGKLAMQTGVYRLRPVTEEAIEVYHHLLSQKGIVLENKIDDGLEACFDEKMLQSVLRNLLSNAIKFTPPTGRITIGATKHKNFVEITIDDSGTGMTESQIKTLFSVAGYVSTEGTMKEKGHGFGLEICRQFITRHGGQIRAEQRPGGGSRFIFTLPDKKRL